MRGPTRGAPRSTIALLIVAQPVVVLLVLLSSPQVLRPIARATHWVVHPDLLAGGILLLLLVGGIVFGHGKLRPGDVGLVLSDLPQALVVTGAMWLATQALLVLASLLATGSVGWHPNWSEPGTVAMLGFLVAMLLGTPLYEEVVFRGFLFPQLLLKLPGGPRSRLAAAALLSAAIFAVLHIPNRLLVGQLAAMELIPQMAGLTMAGLVGVVLYLRTRNLLVVTGIHALVNAPTPLVTAPVNPFVFIATLTAILWIALAAPGPKRPTGSLTSPPPGHTLGLNPYPPQ